MHDICGTVMDMKATETPDRAKARARQQLRASNAAVPIPKAQHKRSRSFERQQLRESYR